ncbi:MAG: hypothetical protein R2749_13095 [Acidimicrobiales bacterium]
MERNRWKLIAGGAILTGLAFGGVRLAGADEGELDLRDRGPVTLTARDVGEQPTPSLAAAAFVDASPESVDSPNESVAESADSPFDSPDDAQWVDASPESVDSPNESAQDSPDMVVAPALAPAPAPAAAPAPAPADSWDSPDAAYESYSVDSGD